MPKINKIYEMFAEDAYNNMYQCKVEGQGIEYIKESTPIYLQKWDNHHPLFTYLREDNGIRKEELITLTFGSDVEIQINPIEPPSFMHLFWIEPKEGEEFIFKFIECGEVNPLPHLDIAIDNNALINLGEANIEKLINRLSGSYIFDAGKYQLLFARSWQNGSQEWHLYGIHSGKERDSARYIEVPLEENEKSQKIRLVRREMRGKRVVFPTLFDKLDVYAYETIDFVDVGNAHEAQEAIKQRQQSGAALISLWKTYSDMELKIAKEESEELGFIKYKFDRLLSNGTVRLKLNVNHDQSIKLLNLAASRAQFEIVDSQDEKQNTIITLTNYSHYEYTGDFDYEQPNFQESGEIKLSSIGDEVVNNRRQFAIKCLSKPSKIVLNNLLFAIENEAESMLEYQHKPIPALSNKTRTFLQEKFGIENLTSNQEEAVRIALNNLQDITIIQGPPGTGKTTVVAAICHRLLELANKNNKQSADKVILASAFQNDTIEHLASKIYTHGLPTVKIGRKTMGVKAEDVFIKELEQYLQKEIDQRGGNQHHLISSQLSDVAVIFQQEKNVEETLNKVEDIIAKAPHIEGIDLLELHHILRAMTKFNKEIKEKESLIGRIPTTEDTYNFDNGFDTLIEVLENDFNISDEDRQLLELAPEMNPEDEFLSKLVLIKEQLSQEISEKKSIATDNFYNEIILWLSDATQSAKFYEESSYTNEDEFILSILSELKDDLQGNTAYIRRTLQEYGETIAATNQLAGSKEMKDFEHIKNVILEEAARSNPLDLLIPMIKAEDRIIMVGDQNQLPHLLETEVAERSLANDENVDTRKEKRRLYEKSLFGIIFDNVKKGKRPRCITLEEQFRMHPSIGDFISKTYYEGKLKAGTPHLEQSKAHSLSLPWAKGKTMVFCNVDGTVPEGKGQSKYRTAEAIKVMSIIDELKTDADFDNISVGVITFYSRQVNTLFEEAAKPEHGYAIKGRDGYEISPSYQTFKGDKEKLRIGSVDSFQGKEFDVVILSTVRSNSYAREDGNEKKVFGFLTLANRLNVAFSRAKKMVIVVGDAEMFEDDFAKKYVPGLYEFCTNISRNNNYGNRI